MHLNYILVLAEFISVLMCDINTSSTQRAREMSNTFTFVYSLVYDTSTTLTVRSKIIDRRFKYLHNGVSLMTTL